MTIVIVTVGSHGDVKPFIRLSKELQQKGHNVKIVTFDKYKNYIVENGISYGKLTGDAEELMDKIIGDGVNCFQFIFNLRKLIKKYIRGIMSDITLQCDNADLIIYTYLASFMYHYAEWKNIKCIRVSFWPDIINSDAPLPTFPVLKIGGWYNKFSYRLAHIINSIYTSLYFNRWRNEQNLSKWGMKSYRIMHNKPIPTLYAFSESIIKKPPEWSSNESITGYWENNNEGTTDFTPDDGLMNFIEDGDKPLYFGFGSMAGGDFDKLLNTIIEALSITKKRAIFGAGWSKIKDKVLPPNIYPVEYVPHSWLFKRVSAVIHHGGAGTTAIGLLEGCPTLIIPFGGDQNFWGTKVYELGLGPKPIKRSRLTTKALVKAINYLCRADVRNNVKIISTNLKSENGIEKATNIIQGIIENIYTDC